MREINDSFRNICVIYNTESKWYKISMFRVESEELIWIDVRKLNWRSKKLIVEMLNGLLYGSPCSFSDYDDDELIQQFNEHCLKIVSEGLLRTTVKLTALVDGCSLKSVVEYEL